MLMYNQLEYIDNYCVTTGTLWNYYRDVVNDGISWNRDDNYSLNNEKTSTGESFQYKTKIIGITPISKNTLDIVVSLK